MTDGGAGVVLVTDAGCATTPTHARSARIDGWGHRTVGLGLQQKLDRSADDPYVMPHVRRAVLDAFDRAQRHPRRPRRHRDPRLLHPQRVPRDRPLRHHRPGRIVEGDRERRDRDRRAAAGQPQRRPDRRRTPRRRLRRAHAARRRPPGQRQRRATTRSRARSTFATLNIGGSTATTVSFVVGAAVGR